MRYGSCLDCRTETDPHLLTVAGTLGGQSHHHHIKSCKTCGAWWFDDHVTGPLGLPVLSRRDTVACGCPVDGEHGYARAVFEVREPEADCHCTWARLGARTW
jgi:hypothetical protein